MEKTIKRLYTHLKEHMFSISVAESITAGKLQDALASVSGATANFECGITAYNLAAKVILLGVDKREAVRCNCVSAEVAKQMAEGIRKKSGSTIGLATTGYSEEYLNEKPIVFIAVSVAGHETQVIRHDLTKTKSREDARQVAAQKALDFTNLCLTKFYPPQEIEYKFLPNQKHFDIRLIKSRAFETQSIKQCYLSTHPDRTSRIRIINDELGCSTTKMPENVEIEFETPIESAHAIYDSFNGGVGTVEKTRYKLHLSSVVVEVDVFHGRHEGLVLIEIEVPDKEFKLPKLPDWIGFDVTSDSQYRNARLAAKE